MIIGTGIYKQFIGSPLVTLLDNFLELTHCEYTEVYGALRKFSFNGDELKLSVKDLSPGQRARLAFARRVQRDIIFNFS